MRVVVETPTELVARHAPWKLPLLLALAFALCLGLGIRDRASHGTWDLVGLGLGLLVLGVGTALVSRHSEFHFDAGRGELRWRRWSPIAPWPRNEAGTLPLADIEGILRGHQRDEEGVSYRVELVTREGRLPLTPHYSTVEPHDETVAKIRAWLQRLSEPTHGEPVRSA